MQWNKYEGGLLNQIGLCASHGDVKDLSSKTTASLIGLILPH